MRFIVFARYIDGSFVRVFCASVDAMLEAVALCTNASSSCVYVERQP